VSGCVPWLCVPRALLRGPSRQFVGPSSAPNVGRDGELLGDEFAGLLGADRPALKITDGVGFCSGEGEPRAFGEASGNHAQGFEVRCSSLGHLRVVDRGQLRIELAGGVGGLDQLAA
jgi:hypothetical protein